MHNLTQSSRCVQLNGQKNAEFEVQHNIVSCTDTGHMFRVLFISPSSGLVQDKQQQYSQLEHICYAIKYQKDK